MLGLQKLTDLKLRHLVLPEITSIWLKEIGLV